ncbi:MAG: hypothetical protein ACXW14_13660, partial [Burkholderiaceae bacterium]
AALTAYFAAPVKGCFMVLYPFSDSRMFYECSYSCSIWWLASTQRRHEAAAAVTTHPESPITRP